MARILLAEDDESMLNFLELALARAGHDVFSTSNGASALAELENNGPFDLLLTDVVMPGMDGIELSQKASSLYPNIKIMFITGFAAIAIQKIEPQTDTRMLSKPFHLNDLVEQVAQTLAEDKKN